MSCPIPANPDISGIGVRVAIYAQNILSFIPAFYALFNDGEVDSYELKIIEDQSTTILVTAFAILISTIVQARTYGLTGFDTSVILNLSWMNNTNTLIYFILYVHHHSGVGKVESRWMAWIQHAKGWVSLRSGAPSHNSGAAELEIQDQQPKDDELGNADDPNTGPTARVLSMVVAAIGSIHLTLMAAVGIWLWSSPAHFESSQPDLRMPEYTALPLECTSIWLLGHPTNLTSPGLREWSIFIYSLFLIPVINLFLPALLFLAFYISFQRWYPKTEQGHRMAGGCSVIIGLSALLAINAVFVVDTELTIARVRDQQLVDSAWTFGQTLALLLLALPIRDTALLESYRRDSKRRQEMEKFRAALRKNDIQTVRTLVQKQHVDVNLAVGIRTHASALHMAAAQGSESLTRYLLEHNADCNAVDMFGWTPLHRAAQASSEPVVRLLLERDADLKAVDGDGSTPLHYAAKIGSESVVRLLLDHDADPQAVDKNGWSSLHRAARAGSEAVARLLLDHKADPKLANKFGSTPLHTAAYVGSGSVVRLLLDREADPKAVNQTGSTPLHCAAEASSESVVQLLLDRDADIEAADEDGLTPLHRAAQAGSAPVVKLLLDHHADPMAVEKFRWTPVHYAARAGSQPVVRLLLDHKSDAGATTKDGKSPLHFAAGAGSEPVARLLLEHDADPKAVAYKNGSTPLHFAAHAGSRPVVRLLLARGADPKVVNKYGSTPLHCAVEAGSAPVVRLLLDHNADPRALNKDSKTPVHYAVQNRFVRIEQLLRDHAMLKAIQ